MRYPLFRFGNLVLDVTWFLFGDSHDLPEIVQILQVHRLLLIVLAESDPDVPVSGCDPVSQLGSLIQKGRVRGGHHHTRLFLSIIKRSIFQSIDRGQFPGDE